MHTLLAERQLQDACSTCNTHTVRSVRVPHGLYNIGAACTNDSMRGSGIGGYRGRVKRGMRGGGPSPGKHSQHKWCCLAYRGNICHSKSKPVRIVTADGDDIGCDLHFTFQCLLVSWQT